MMFDQLTIVLENMQLLVNFRLLLPRKTLKELQLFEKIMKLNQLFGKVKTFYSIQLSIILNMRLWMGRLEWYRPSANLYIWLKNFQIISS